jgi:hypothetical protein
MNITFHPKAMGAAVRKIENSEAIDLGSLHTFLGHAERLYLTNGLSRGKMGEYIPY